MPRNSFSASQGLRPIMPKAHQARSAYGWRVVVVVVTILLLGHQITCVFTEELASHGLLQRAIIFLCHCPGNLNMVSTSPDHCHTFSEEPSLTTSRKTDVTPCNHIITAFCQLVQAQLCKGPGLSHAHSFFSNFTSIRFRKQLLILRKKWKALQKSEGTTTGRATLIFHMIRSNSN